MTDEQVPVSPPAEIAERFPFWGYADVLLIAGLALPCMFAGWALVHLAIWAGHLHLPLGVQAVPEMVLGYGLLFTALMVVFRVQYERPFWRSLGWTETKFPIVWCVFAGFLTTVLVGVAGWLIRTPPSSGPLMEMMRDRTSLIVLAVFGTTAAPLFEELAFRGFLQPLLVRSVGAVGGVVLASALFGGLHYSEYGDSWRSALLVALAGAAFGCMRQWTGSTLPAVIMHATFNGLQFMAIFAPGRGGPH
jgi:membrane protease YdiL (CAAX protease family)